MLDIKGTHLESVLRLWTYLHMNLQVSLQLELSSPGTDYDKVMLLVLRKLFSTREQLHVLINGK